MALEVGTRIGHYEVTALIGEGGMGQVYQATDTKLNRQPGMNESIDKAKIKRWRTRDARKRYRLECRAEDEF